MYELIKPEIMEYHTLNDGICITRLKCDTPFIVIPQHIDDLPVTKIGDFALFSEGCSNYIDIPTIILPETLKYIGQGAFENFINIEEIIFTENLIALGKSACKGLKKLKNIIFRNCNKLTDIPESCFENCGSLKKVYLPKNIESIGHKAFYGIKKLDLYLNNSISMICEDAFGFQKGTPKITLHFPPNFDYKFLNLSKDISCLNDNNSANDDFKFKYRINKNGLVINGMNGSTSKIIIPDYAVKNGEKQPVIGVEMQQIDNLYPIEEIQFSKNVKNASMIFTDRTMFLTPVILDHDYEKFVFSGKTVCFVAKGCNLQYYSIYNIIAFEDSRNMSDNLSSKQNIFEKNSLNYQDYKNISELMEINEFYNINIQDIIFEDNFIYLIYKGKGSIVYCLDNTFNSEITIKNYIRINDQTVPIVNCLTNAFKDISSCKKLIISKNVEIIGKDAFTGNFDYIAFEEGSHLKFVGEGNFINSHNQIILPQTVKALFGKNFSSEEGFKFEPSCDIEYLGPGSFNNCLDRALPRSVRYLEYFCSEKRSIAFENGINLEIFLSSLDLDYLFDRTFEFEGCLYAGPQDNPFMLLIKVLDTNLPCIKVHEECKIVLLQALEKASNLMKIILNEGLISFFCLFYDFCAPIITSWPKSLKFVSREYLNTFKRVRCNPLTCSQLPAETTVLSNIPDSYEHNIQRAMAEFPPIFGNVVKINSSLARNYGLQGLFECFLDYYSGFFSELEKSYHDIELVSCDYITKKIKPLRNHSGSNALNLPVLDFVLLVDGLKIEIFIDRYYSHIWYKDITDDDFIYATEIPDRIFASIHWLKENYNFK